MLSLPFVCLAALRLLKLRFLEIFKNPVSIDSDRSIERDLSGISFVYVELATGHFVPCFPFHACPLLVYHFGLLIRNDRFFEFFEFSHVA